MTSVNFGVSKNKRGTKYLTPSGKEVNRTSVYKKILGDPWSMFGAGQYKGAEITFSALTNIEKDLGFIDYADFKKRYFNDIIREKSNFAKRRGTQNHLEIQEALEFLKTADKTKVTENMKEAKENLVELLMIPIEIDGQITYVANPFAQPLIDDIDDGWIIELVEETFTYESPEIEYGGGLDLFLRKGEKRFKMKDFKTSEKPAISQYSETYLEYGMQLAAYRKPILERYGSNIDLSCEILFEDQTVVFYPNDLLDFLFQLFVQNAICIDLTKRSLEKIKELRQSQGLLEA